MKTMVEKDTWVEIRRVVLEPGRRAPQVPGDTAALPLEMRVKGFLTGPGAVGEEVTVVTAAGRRVSGILTEINPAYTHTFGPPVPELTAVGPEVRALLRKAGEKS